jgi:hypothetical protein
VVFLAVIFWRVFRLAWRKYPYPDALSRSRQGIAKPKSFPNFPASPYRFGYLNKVQTQTAKGVEGTFAPFRVVRKVSFNINGVVALGDRTNAPR